MGLFSSKSKVASEGEDQSKGQGGNVIEIPIPEERSDQNISDLPSIEDDFGNSFEGNQFKSLKTKLLFPASGKLRRTIAVTSPGIGEGKTFVATNLAISLSQNIDGRPILLIDCDVRLPTIHKLFGIKDGSAGLSEYLSGNIPLESVILQTKFENLSVFPGGRSGDNPSELLSSRKMLNTLEEIQSRFVDSHIILDLPSPRLMAEAEMIAGRLDGVIAVVKYGKTNKKQLNELIGIVGKENLMGVVFNEFDTTMHSSIYRVYRKYIRRR